MTYVRLPPNNDRSCMFDEADNTNVVTNHMNKKKTHHHYISSSSFYIWPVTIEQSKYVTSFREKQATDHFYYHFFVMYPWCTEIVRYHCFFASQIRRQRKNQRCIFILRSLVRDEKTSWRATADVFFCSPLVVRVADGKNSVCTNSLEIQVHSVVATYFPHKGESRVYIELSGNWQTCYFSFSSSSNLQSKVFVLCPQLHCVVVKHIVSYE
jgi:hypothetical protein